MRRILLATIFAVLIAAALAAGCGDDDSNGPEGGPNGSGASTEPVTTSSLTKAEFIKQANALCLRNREERIKATVAYTRQDPAGLGGEDIAATLRAVYAPALEDRAAGFRELGAPRGDEQQIEELINAIEGSREAIEQLEKEPSSPQLDRETKRAEDLARQYKLTKCVIN